MMGELKVFAGQATESLTAEICKQLGLSLGKREIIQFSNDNTFVKISENVRDCDVFVVQTSCPPVNHNLMELLVMLDALRRASARRITAVLPLYPYARSDKKDQPRVPITARLVADLLTTAGADRVVAIDLHSSQIQGFFTIPLDHLTAADMLCSYFHNKGIEDLTVVATDAGGAKKASVYAKWLDAPLAIMDKRRSGNDDKAMVANFIGDVRGKNAVILDDEIDTAGTVKETVKALRKAGAKDIYVGCTHAVFSGPAVERLEECNLKELVVTDTVPTTRAKNLSCLKVLSVAPMLAQAIDRIHRGESVSTLFRA
jgi:ribose-phosphate pyrophosphokinase